MNVMLVSVPEIGSPAKVETLRTRADAELKADVVELKHASGE